MNKLLLVIITGIFSVAIPLKAQRPVFDTILYNPPFQGSFTHKNNYCPLYSNGTEVIVSDHDNGASLITAYDALTLKKKRNLSLEDPTVDGNSAGWISLFFKGDDIFSFYAIYDHKDKNFIYGKVTNSHNEIVTAEKPLGGFKSSFKDDYGAAGVKSSEDKSKFLMYMEPKPKEGNPEIIELWLYDEQLQLSYKRRFTLPYNNMQLLTRNYYVTNTGKVLITSKYDETKGYPASFKLFVVDDKNLKLQELNIAPAGEVLISSMVTMIDSGQRIVLTGYYKNEIKETGAAGIFYVKLNPDTWEVDITQFNKIASGLGMSNYVLKDLFVDRKGNMKLTAQFELSYVQCYSNLQSPGKNCTYTYKSMSIVEFQLDARGNLLNSIIIPNRQVVNSAEEYLGHISLVSAFRIFYIFNDNLFNLDQKPIRGQVDKFAFNFDNSNDSRLVYVYNNKDDTLTKTAMYPTLKTSVKIMPSANTLRMSDNSVFVWAKRRKSKEMILMRIGLK